MVDFLRGRVWMWTSLDVAKFGPKRDLACVNLDLAKFGRWRN